MKSVEFVLNLNAVEDTETIVIYTNEHCTAEMLSYFSTVRNLCLARNHGAKPFIVVTSLEFCF